MTANRYILTTNGNFYLVPSGAELYHHGVKGQKWGVRRYQNEDGSLTPAGKRRAAKLNEKLSDTRQEASNNYSLATESAKLYRTTDNRVERNLYRNYGIKQMDKAFNLDKKISKIEKKLKNIGVNPEKDKAFIESRTKAGEEYVKRSTAERAADVVGTTIVNAGAITAQMMLGAPIIMGYFPTPNKHKLR